MDCDFSAVPIIVSVSGEVQRPEIRSEKMKRKVPVAVTVVLLILAIASCIFGVHRGELKTISKKANTVCLECIGIG